MRPPNSLGDGALVLDESLFAFNVSWLKKTKKKANRRRPGGYKCPWTCSRRTPVESRLLSHFTHRRWRAACEQSARLRQESWFCGFQDLSACDVPALRAGSQGKEIVNHLVQDCVTLLHSSLIPPTPVCPVQVLEGSTQKNVCPITFYCKIQPLKYAFFLHVMACLVLLLFYVVYWLWRYYYFALMRMCYKLLVCSCTWGVLWCCLASSSNSSAIKKTRRQIK